MCVCLSFCVRVADEGELDVVEVGGDVTACSLADLGVSALCVCVCVYVCV